MNYREEIERLLQPLPQQFVVRYALAIAWDVYPLVKDEDRAVIKACLDAVEAWLKGKATAKEVEAAGDKAWAAYHAASATSYAASHAASLAASYASSAAFYAASAASTASHAASLAASHAAYYASHAASAASAASHASSTSYASHAASQSCEEGIKKYHSLLIEMIRDLSETEKILWGLE